MLKCYNGTVPLRSLVFRTVRNTYDGEFCSSPTPKGIEMANSNSSTPKQVLTPRMEKFSRPMGKHVAMCGVDSPSRVTDIGGAHALGVEENGPAPAA